MLSTAENEILLKIRVPSEDDPAKPEFPFRNPHFPATPTRKIEIPGFSNVWLKDESVNELSGTHKDRLAWEVVVIYRDILLAKQGGQYSGPLPQFSIISSGSAAIAIGRTLREFGLPKIKVLVDTHIHRDILSALGDAHCEVYETSLEERELEPEDILQLTENQNGFDLTSNRGIALEIGNYDWMSFEILNERPDYLFIPFGTGTVFKKILEVTKNVVRLPFHDKRFDGDSDTLRQCNFRGATTKNPDSIADKLYSPFLPYAGIGDDWIRFYKAAGYCGGETGIAEVTEEALMQAMNLAQEQGITCEPSGIAGLALLLQEQDLLPKDKRILIINTGKLTL